MKQLVRLQLPFPLSLIGSIEPESSETAKQHRELRSKLSAITSQLNGPGPSELPEILIVDDELPEILIVDDEERTLKLLEKINSTRKFGFKLITTTNPKRAIEIIENENNIKSVITDLRMPIMNGWELARKIRAINHRIPIGIITGYDDSVIQSNNTMLVINKVLHKPIGDLDILRNVFRELVGFYPLSACV